MKIGERVTIKTDWEDQAEARRKEARFVAMIERWVVRNEPPAEVQFSTDNGFRVFVFPGINTTDEEKHKLLAWLVRASGKKFMRVWNEADSRVFWWNDIEDRNFTDDEGEFNCIFLFERPALGGCKIVEEEKMVKVKRLVCQD